MGFGIRYESINIFCDLIELGFNLIETTPAYQENELKNKAIFLENIHNKAIARGNAIQAYITFERLKTIDAEFPYSREIEMDLLKKAISASLLPLKPNYELALAFLARVESPELLLREILESKASDYHGTTVLANLERRGFHTDSALIPQFESKIAEKQEAEIVAASSKKAAVAASRTSGMRKRPVLKNMDIKRIDARAVNEEADKREMEWRRNLEHGNFKAESSVSGSAVAKVRDPDALDRLAGVMPSMARPPVAVAAHRAPPTPSYSALAAAGGQIVIGGLRRKDKTNGSSF